MQNPCIILVPNSEHAYSEPLQASTMRRFAKRVNSHNYIYKFNYFCNISFSRSPPYEINIMNFFNAGLIFGPEVFILCKKYRLEGRGP